MIGGTSFERSQFNRAMQAMRQVGSLFKPFVYTTAIDRGYTASSILIDEPVSFPAGPGQPPYEPKNYEKNFEGEVTLRHALEHSRNVPTVRLMNDARPRERHRLRAADGHHVADSAVPLVRHRRRRGDARSR